MNLGLFINNIKLWKSLSSNNFSTRTIVEYIAVDTVDCLLTKHPKRLAVLNINFHILGCTIIHINTAIDIQVEVKMAKALRITSHFETL